MELVELLAGGSPACRAHSRLPIKPYLAARISGNVSTACWRFSQLGAFLATRGLRASTSGGGSKGVVDRVATGRAEAIEEFADVLRAVRIAAGSPSFRTMSGRSHAISHTTLHEAAQGHRLPSWATTAEFVKACNRDPAEFRERWELANRAIRSVATDSPAVADPSAAADPDSPRTRDGSADPAIGPVVHVPKRWLRHVVLAAVLVGVLAVGSVIIDVMGSSGDSANGRQGFSPQSSAAQRLTSADCPVQQTNPPHASPVDLGDVGVFVGDISLPDCTHVARGSTVTKVWRFKNAGTVPWHGYALHRIDTPQQRDECQTITDTPIKDTEPGQMVDVRVSVMAPSNPGFCFVRFKIEDAEGRIAFPGSRPVNFQLIVD